ncbi:MAG: hypothetical protein HGA62_07425 [Chlorobiaceae bacterium]|nr:hypothetical protein [Chlorobiaceae bacterium]NTV59885.1 hypothetical protein [Chlorobiaceae bacterium]
MTEARDKAIQENRNEILRRWKHAGLSLFSEAHSPSPLIAEVLGESMGALLDAMASGDEKLSEPLDAICRMLAVQPFRPSTSMRLFTCLKTIVPETLRDAAGHTAPEVSLVERFQSRTDEIILMAFDRFMTHREELYKLKVEESRNRMHMALRRAGV